ncbi:tetratricopeptide repeat protein [Streptomyces griseorubiginosus]|uniref:tetratricopeptide repeat protein n=1 Tax=Streptomyces griseorubiginosus TaxID=67304 RepID=UPI0036921C5D
MWDQGELDEARSEFEAILAHRRDSLGDTHPDTLTARHELALVLRDQGELDRARSKLEAILAHRRDSLGDTHPDTLSTFQAIAGRNVLGSPSNWPWDRCFYSLSLWRLPPIRRSC